MLDGTCRPTSLATDDVMFLGQSSSRYKMKRSNFRAQLRALFLFNFGNHLRSYSDPWPLDLDPSFENEKQSHGARGLSRLPLRQATSNCVEYQARRGGGTTIPYHGSLLSRSLASP